MGRSTRVAILLLALAGAGLVGWRLLAEPGGAPTAAPDLDRPAAAPESPQPMQAATLAPRASQPAAAPPERGGPDSPRAVRVTGRVLRVEGAPSPGAEIDLRIGETASAAGTAGDDGRFDVAVVRPEGDPPAAILVAHDAEGRIAAASVSWRPSTFLGGPGAFTSTIDAGDLVLGAALTLDVLVHDGAGAPAVADVRAVPLWSTSAAALALARADASGHARLQGLTAGPVFVVASSPGGRGGGFVVLPRNAPEPFAVVLGSVRDVEVSVVEKDTRAPVAGAVVAVSELVEMPPSGVMQTPYVPPPVVAATDASGRTRIPGVAATGSLWLSASAAGFGMAASGGWDAGGVTLRANAANIEIPLERERRVTWVVEAGEVPPPAEGAGLRLVASIGSGLTGPIAASDGRIERGRVVVEHARPGTVSCIAVASDGSQARLWAAAGASEGRPTRFLRGRRVDVALTWSGGAPAAEMYVSLRNQGNNPFGGTVATDSSGRAVFEGLEAQMADVYVSTQQGWSGGRRIATCDLLKGDGHVAATLPRRREAIVNVFLDGHPGLPEKIDPGGGSPFGGGVECDLLEKDATRGILRLRLWPDSKDGEATVFFDPPGWLTDGPVRIPLASGTEPAESRLDLRRACGLDVEVVSPPGNHYRLRLEQFDDATSAWTVTHFDTLTFGARQAQVDAEGHWRLPTLEPGRYRVRDLHSSSLSAEVDLAAGGGPVQVRLDLSRVGWVSGRVTVPEGEVLAGIEVRVDAPVPTAPGWMAKVEGAARTDAEGKFRLHVPGGEIALTVDSMDLVPVGGPLRTSSGATDVVLRLARGPVARIQFDRDVPTQMTPGSAHPDSVYFWRGAMSGPPVFSTAATVQGTAARFGRFEPGRWTVMLDLPSCAPVVLTDVDLGPGDTDLGTVALSQGSSLALEIHAPAGQSPPRITVWARRVDAEPHYQRFATVGEKGRVTGLARGRFRVTASPIMGGTALLDREIEVDGVTDVPLVLETK